MSGRDEFYHGIFPEGFMWCAATASYQIEGAWDKDGKGPSIWDTFCHEGSHVLNNDTGDVACDSYHRYEEDVQLLRDMGVSHYRFSISWPRVLPDGTTENINQAGLAYYSRLVDALLAAGVQPVATLYHWDLPQALQDQGGWTNPDISKHFEEYARICFEHLGDRVAWWITVNEPMVVAAVGYGAGIHAPGVQDHTKFTNTIYIVGHNLIRAHARAYWLYDKEFRSKQNGQIGITLNTDWSEPKDRESASDQQASELAMQLHLGWFAGPVFGEDGDYPPAFKQSMEKLCRKIGLDASNSPEFTLEEKRLNKGSSDFFGLNYYTSRLVSMLGDDPPDPGQFLAARFGIRQDVQPHWPRGKSSWLYSVPWGLRELLKWIKSTYHGKPVFITENGFSDEGHLHDDARVDYFRAHINNVLKAIRLDECNVIGYTAWSLMDNFEWARGYSERFGLYHVDFSDTSRPRTAKASARFYKEVIQNNGFPA